ncbi:MAG: TPP-binding protein [Rhodospirillaceae bacterium]|nr:TPP-binding protein [Rhodospirillaceae bacterium]
MADKSTAEIIIEQLLLYDIDTLYCLPGVQSDNFFNALFDYQDRLKPLHVRHEQSAAYMALGAAMATGQPQAFCVVPGPGFLNACAALSTAYAVNAPVFALVSQIGSGALGKGFGHLHEIPDQLGIMKTLTKHAARVTSPEEAVTELRACFDALLSGRPRPVAIEVPMDCWAKRSDVKVPEEPIKPNNPHLDLASIERAADLLAGAKNPMIVVGGGAREASADLRRLAEYLQAPVSAFRNGQGIMDARHYLSVTSPLGNKLWKECDVVLGIGTRLQPQIQMWGSDDKLKIIRIEVDEKEMHRIRVPDVAILARAEKAVPALLNAMNFHPPHPSREAEMTEMKSLQLAEYEKLTPQYDYLNAIRTALPEDGIFVDELTQVGYVSRFAYPVYEPRTFLSTGYQGTLGWGFASALGAKSAMPDKVVLSISGDGGFMFTASELATAIRHNIGVIAVVFNDNAFGNVRRIQIEDYDGRTIASDLNSPDFVKLADAFGVESCRAASPAALQQEIEKAIERGGPTLIEVPMEDVPSPWSYIMLPKVRG